MRIIGLGNEKSPEPTGIFSCIVRSYPGVSFLHRLSQRLDCSGRFSFRKPLLYGWHRNPQHQPLCHSGCIRRTGNLIVNADLIREITFYTGAFPANRSGALSSVLDFQLKDGNPDKQAFKATIGASEVSLSGAGHLGQRTTYLFSARQSYLQLLFKALGLPFLPNFIDGQFSGKTRFSRHSEPGPLSLAGIDKIELIPMKKEKMPNICSTISPLSIRNIHSRASYRHYNGRRTIPILTITA